MALILELGIILLFNSSTMSTTPTFLIVTKFQSVDWKAPKFPLPVWDKLTLLDTIEEANYTLLVHFSSSISDIEEWDKFSGETYSHDAARRSNVNYRTLFTRLPFARLVQNTLNKICD